MRVAHVVPSIADEASGPSLSVPNLCQALTANGIEIELHVNLGEKPLNANYDFFAHGRYKWPPRLDISPKMYSTIKNNIHNYDIIHSHGLWNMANIYPGWVVKKNIRCALITSTRGTLSRSALQKSRWKKFVIWSLWQRRVIEATDCIHVTSYAELQQVRAVGLKAPASIVPNGINIPQLAVRPMKREGSVRKLLFLGRITPIKGIDILLNAWSIIQNMFPAWELCLVGPDDRGYLKEMKTLARKVNAKQIKFVGPLYGNEKREAFLGADLFILPTYSENFAMAVAEALSYEVPVIVSKGAPWSGINDHDCGWWIDIGSEPLVECLRTALAHSPETLQEKGKRGRKWMERDFSWQTIGKKIFKTYEWVLNGGTKPDWVYTNE